MYDKYFHTAVTVSQGAGDDKTILSLTDMEHYLQTWRGRRGQLYEIAQKACEAARKGYITMEQTRRTLVAFASASGRLRQDMEPEAAAQSYAQGFGRFAG